MRKDVMMISAGLMMLAIGSCDKTEYTRDYRRPSCAAAGGYHQGG